MYGEGETDFRRLSKVDGNLIWYSTCLPKGVGGIGLERRTRETGVTNSHTSSHKSRSE